MSSIESKVDVLIIGAGPAGLLAAHGLVKSGVNVRIIDQRYAYGFDCYYCTTRC